jgi:YYY domain-containing protein
VIDLLRWAIAIEIIGIAFLPIAFRLFRTLPDRGYIFAKIIGLVLITYFTWLVGSFLPVASSMVLPLIVLILGGAVCWSFLQKDTLETLWELRRAILVEEVLFLGALILLSVLRAQVFHPGIGHTEQYMDMSFLGASIRSGSYPPYDPWMSGHTINYYYVGYLMFGLLTKLAGVAPTVGYNLSLSLLFAFVVAGAFSLGYALTRRLSWALLSPLFVAFVGNWHAILVQAPDHQNPATTYFWFWGSTRVIGSNTNITEFPFFSFMLGDLHPHVMSFPLVLLALALGCNIVLSPGPLRLGRTVDSLLPLALLSLTVGMMFTVNSWDFPTYLLVTAACITAHGFLSDDQRGWWRQPALVIGAVAVASVVLYAPFYSHFRSPTHGLGFVNTPSDFLEFLQVMGIVLLPAVLLIGSLAMLFQPTGDVDERNEPFAATGTRATEAGTSGLVTAVQIALYALLCLVVIVAAHDHVWVLLLMLALGAGGLFVLYRVLHAVEPSREDSVALIFILVACLVVAIPEVVYVRDVFDGGPDYRMNTLFKLYYQAWTLLGVAGAYAVYRGWSVLKQYFSSIYAWGAAAVIAVTTLGGLYYTVNAPQSANQGGIAQSLDGSSMLQANAPGDYAAVQWLRSHVRGNPTELEATGGAYDAKFARISTFTGLPTVMGWADHEFQWRGADPDIQRRVDDIKTVYTTSNLAEARTLLRQYGVRYVIVGPTEQQTYPGPGLTKFSRFMHTAFSSGGTTVYTWKSTT